MKSLIEKLQEITENKIPDRHSYFQLKYFVIGKEPTTQAKIRACIIELKTRKDSLENIELQLRELKEVKQINKLRQKLQYIEQECLFLMEMYEDLIKIEEPKDWDDFKVQTEYWNAKLNIELNSRLLLGQPIDVELVKTICALPDQTPVKQRLMGLVQPKLEKNEQNIES